MKMLKFLTETHRLLKLDIRRKSRSILCEVLPVLNDEKFPTWLFNNLERHYLEIEI